MCNDWHCLRYRCWSILNSLRRVNDRFPWVLKFTERRCACFSNNDKKKKKERKEKHLLINKIFKENYLSCKNISTSFCHFTDINEANNIHVISFAGVATIHVKTILLDAKLFCGALEMNKQFAQAHILFVTYMLSMSTVVNCPPKWDN